MRIDKFLKKSQLVKRRSIAKKACDAGKVSVNGRTAKPASEVKAGDEITIEFFNRKLSVRVEKLLARSVKKSEAREMYSVIEEKNGIE